MKKIFFLLACLMSFMAVFAQNAKVKGWHLLDPEKDGYLGVGINRAYELLKNRKSTEVIVAVIDSGVDTLHADLKANLWINRKEVNGNKKDDDGNGYTDDIYGWNFCGNKQGENLATNTYEIARVYHGWKKEFDGKSEKDIPQEKQFLFSQWKRSQNILNKQYEQYTKNYPGIEEADYYYNLTANIIKRKLSLEAFGLNEIKNIKIKSDSLGWAMNLWKEMFARTSDSATVNSSLILDEITQYKNQLLKYKNSKDDAPVDHRGAMTGDKYTDITDRIYGNNNLTQHSGNHGTSVSGVIAAVRNNNLGVDGEMNNVKVMVLRAVPGGDEHDKDVALSIRYAVDNGAKIINMSFGKPVSPYKYMVDDAIKYAAGKGVLLIHGAGNDGQNLDEEPFYPNPNFLDHTKASNMLTVGASSDKSIGNVIADFSNYSGKEVDVFAPGTYISTTAGNSTYQEADGTSLASPVAAGVAGLLKSYFPALTPAQLISILKRSVTKIKEEVNVPGSDSKATMDKLCSSGGIINAYEAVKLALKEEKLK